MNEGIYSMPKIFGQMNERIHSLTNFPSGRKSNKPAFSSIQVFEYWTMLESGYVLKALKFIR